MMTAKIYQVMTFGANYVFEGLVSSLDITKIPKPMLLHIRMAGFTPVISHTATQSQRSGISSTERRN